MYEIGALIDVFIVPCSS